MTEVTSGRQRSHAVKVSSFGVVFKQPENCGELQQSIISTLVYALAKEYGQALNYDHVNLAVPKSPVPIQYRNHRYDISMTDGKRVILIDVLNIDVAYFERGKEAQSAEG